jgi:glycopeptide antibiotics resistance protein
LFASWIVVLVGGLVPWGDVTNHTHWFKVVWVPFAPPLHPIDIAGNVLVFVPFGYWWRRSRWPAPVTALFAALALSFSAEALQLFSHSRIPSATDVATNVLGAAFGLWLARTREAP